MPSLGFTLVGSDVKLNSPSSLIGQALTEILQHPERARDALRVLLHLVRADGTLGEPEQGASENQLGQHEMGNPAQGMVNQIQLPGFLPEGKQNADTSSSLGGYRE